MKENSILFPRKESPYPDKIFIIDCAWTASELTTGDYLIEPQQWCIAGDYGSGFQEKDITVFDDRIDLCNYLDAESEGCKKIVVIGYDMAALIRLARIEALQMETEWKGKQLIVGGHVCVAVLDRDGCSMQFLDIRNWVNEPFPKLAEYAGIDWENILDWDINFPLHYRSVEMRLRILIRVWNRYRSWVGEHCLGGYTTTISSLSFNYWSRKMERSERPRRSRDWVHTVEQRAVYGGFCLAHKNGIFNDDHYYLLDCNGLYGWVEENKNLPKWIKTIRNFPTGKEFEDMPQCGECLVYGTFQLDNGYLPIRQHNKTVWGQGEITTWLAYPELNWVREHGKILQMDSMIIYSMEPMMKRVCEFYRGEQERAESNGMKFERKLWKLMRNALFGKCAQRFGRTEQFPQRDYPDLCEGISLWGDPPEPRHIRAWCGEWLITPENGDNINCFPAVSAWITSHARVRLWGLCDLAGWSNVFYNDTDSLIVNREGYYALQHLIKPGVSGFLKLEDQGEVLTIVGQKRYHLGNTLKDSTTPNRFTVGDNGCATWQIRETGTSRSRERMGSIYVRRIFSQNFKDQLEKQAKLQNL